jgi:hypothetical protein
MQFLSSFSGIFAFFFFISHVKFIDADKVVLVAFNNGIAPSSTQTCSSTDNQKIDNALAWVSLTRSLRSVGIMPNETSIISLNQFWNEEPESRDLATISDRCRRACSGYVTGTCRAIGCVGVRRVLKNGENVDNERELQDAVCDRSISQINSALNNLISTNAISNACKSFIDASKRKYTCYDDMIYGEVNTLKFWNVANAASPSLMTELAVSSLPVTLATTVQQFVSGYSFCSSTKFTVEVTGNECIEVISFHLYRFPNDWPNFIHKMDDYSAPFTLYGNDANGRMNGVTLPAGQYMMDVKPNWFVGKEKRMRFTVLNC